MKKSTLIFGGSIAAIALYKSGIINSYTVSYYLPQVQNVLSNLFR